jgi:hypothetical protein
VLPHPALTPADPKRAARMDQVMMARSGPLVILQGPRGMGDGRGRERGKERIILVAPDVQPSRAS